MPTFSWINFKYIYVQMKGIPHIKLVGVIFLLLTPAVFYGQLDTEMDSNGYFVKMNNTLNLRLDLDNDVRSFEFNTTNDTYSILPNTNGRIAFAYNYRFLTFKIGFSPAFLASGDSGEKGKTTVFRLTLDMFIKDFYQTFDYDQTKGYYIDGNQGSFPGLNPSEGEFIILPDMRTFSITGITRYRFNENYSFKALVNQTEIQTKSAGSFVPELRYGFWQIKQPSGPQDIESFYFLVNAGYHYTFVISNNWYANLGLSTGLGIEFNKIDTRAGEFESTERTTSAVFDVNTQIGLGYNSRRIYAGTALIGSAITRNEESLIKFDNVRGYFKIFVGYRFDPPRALVKAMDWVESKNPFGKK
ncbi:MAG: DUF4421 family protein [Lutimonas sp.]